MLTTVLAGDTWEGTYDDRTTVTQVPGESDPGCLGLCKDNVRLKMLALAVHRDVVEELLATSQARQGAPKGD